MTSNEAKMYHQLFNSLSEGKYTQWMAKLTVDQLLGLLWLVGEYAARASGKEHDLEKISYPGNRRKFGALNGIAAFKRSPMTQDEVRHYMRQCISGPQSDADFVRRLKAKNNMQEHARIEAIAKRLEEPQSLPTENRNAPGCQEDPNDANDAPDILRGFRLTCVCCHRLYHQRPTNNADYCDNCIDPGHEPCKFQPSDMLSCGCPDGAHPNIENQLKGDAERHNMKLCRLGWPK